MVPLFHPSLREATGHPGVFQPESNRRSFDCAPFGRSAQDDIKHPNVANDLQGHIGSLAKESESPNRIILSGEMGRAIIRSTWEGKSKKWLVTAFLNKEALSAAEGERSPGTDRAEPAPEIPAGQGAGNAEASVARPDAEGNEPDVLHQARRGRLIVRVEKDPQGNYYDIRTAMEPRADQFKNKKPLWERAGSSTPSGSEEPNPLGPRGQSVDSSVAQPEREGNEPDVLHQAQRGRGGRGRKALNLEAARVQGEMLKPGDAWGGLTLPR